MNSNSSLQPAPTETTSAIADSLTSFDSFTLFPKLPLEHRLAIWEFAIASSRSGVIGYKKDRTKFNIGRRYTVSAKVPAITQSCRESRAVGSKIYQLSLQQELENRPVYMNWEDDMLICSSSEAHDFSIRARIKRRSADTSGPWILDFIATSEL
ncbi:hypothetical protein ACEPPN_008393 [Leptodophora sp. 'Broadleaf-Isolate-01']